MKMWHWLAVQRNFCHDWFRRVLLRFSFDAVTRHKYFALRSSCQKLSILACLSKMCKLAAWRIATGLSTQLWDRHRECQMREINCSTYWGDILQTTWAQSQTTQPHLVHEGERKVNQAFKRGGFAVKSSAGMEYEILFNSLSSSWLIVDLLL